jgi:hypothetical protein
MIFSHMKGEALNSQDLDLNFKELLERLERLEKTDFPDFSLTRLETQEDQLVFLGPGDTVLGKIPLPLLIFKDRGPWTPHTSYDLCDYIIHNQCLYVCRTAHQSEDTFDETVWYQQGEPHDLPK